MFLYCCLAYLTIQAYLTYRVVIFLLRETFELHININNWHFDISWDYSNRTPANVSNRTPANVSTTWGSTDTTVVNPSPTPVEDLWPGHPTWNSTSWDVPTTIETINSVVDTRLEPFQQLLNEQHNNDPAVHEEIEEDVAPDTDNTEL
jgi:uncharacterized membrane protein